MDSNPISQPLPISTGIGLDTWYSNDLPTIGGTFEAWHQTPTVLRWYRELTLVPGKGWMAPIKEETLGLAGEIMWRHRTAMPLPLTLPVVYKQDTHVPDNDGWYRREAAPPADRVYNAWALTATDIAYVAELSYRVGIGWGLNEFNGNGELKLTDVLAWRFKATPSTFTRPVWVAEYGKRPDANGWYRGFVEPPKSGKYDIYLSFGNTKPTIVLSVEYSTRYGWAGYPASTYTIYAWRESVHATKPSWID